MQRRRLLLVAVLAGAIALAVGLTVALLPTGHGTPLSYQRGWIPQGVQEVEVRVLKFDAQGQPRPSISRRVTDPSRVRTIIGWFDTLKRPGREDDTICLMIMRNRTVFFTFRAANGEELATVSSTSRGGSVCEPFGLTVGAQEIALIDRPRGHSLLLDVERLLGIDFG